MQTETGQQIVHILAYKTEFYDQLMIQKQEIHRI